MTKPTYWYNCKIPAELFFDILSTENLKLLAKEGKPKKGKLRRAWAKIFDEYFTLKDDSRLRLILKVKGDILRITNKIQTIEGALKVLALLHDYVVVGEVKDALDEVCKSLSLLGIKIDTSKPINKEILNNLNVNVAAFKTKLAIEEDRLKKLTKGVKTTFEDNCVAIEGALGRSINETVSLRKYISYEKDAKKRSDAARAANSRQNKASKARGGR